MVLGIVVDRFSNGLGYERFVQDLLRRIGIFRMKLGPTRLQYADMSQVSVVCYMSTTSRARPKYLFSNSTILSRQPSSRQAVRGLDFQEICSSTCMRAWAAPADVSAAG